MKEQSHKDEMSKALRGDFERLRERGVSVTLAPRETEQPEPVAATEPAVEAPPEPDVEPPIVEPPAEPPAAEAAEPAPAAPDEPEGSDESEAPEPGWLGRLFGR